MFLRPLAVLLGLALLWRLYQEFRPSWYGLAFGLFCLYLPLLGRLPINLAPGINLITLFLVALFCLRSFTGDYVLGESGRTFRNLLLAWLVVGVWGFLLGLGGAVPLSELCVLFKRWVDPILFSLLALWLVQSADRKFVVACVIVGYSLVALQGVREGLDIGHKVRIGGLIGQANELGAFLALYAPVVLIAAISFVKPLLRGVLFGCLIFGVSALVFTQSRTALVAFPFGLMVLLFATGRFGYGFIALLLAVSVWAFPELLPEKAVARFETTYVEGLPGATQQLEISAASRLDLWQGALSMISSHPLGIGFGQFKQQIPQYAPTHEYALDAHNYYLLAWAEFGAIGLAVLVVLLAYMIGNAWALVRKDEDPFLHGFGLSLWAGLAAALLVNFFGSRLMELQVSTYLWIFCAMAASARDTLQEVASVPETPEEDAPPIAWKENAWGLRSYS